MAQEESWLHRNISPLLALITFISSFAIFTLALRYGVKSNDTVSIAIIETLKAIDLILVGYYFGSSQGSKLKQLTIDKIMSKDEGKG